MKIDLIINSFKRLKSLAVKHAPEILAGVGVAGFWATTAIAVKNTPKAMENIKERKAELNLSEDEKLPITETAKAVWREALPVAVTGTASTLCVVGSVSTSLRRNAVLATAYEVSKTFAEEYRSKVIETIGEKKERNIQHSLRQETIDKNPPVANVNATRKPDDEDYYALYYEPITNQYFWEKPRKVDRAAIQAMQEMKNSFENQYSAYSWLSKLPASLLNNLPDGKVQYLTEIGWPTTSMYGEDDLLYIDTQKDSYTVREGEWEGYPAIWLDYSDMPGPDFRSSY